MDKNKFELYLFLDLIDIVLYDNYLKNNLGINYNEKPGYGFIYNTNNRYIIKNNFQINKVFLNKEQEFFIQEIIFFYVMKK